MAVPAMLQNLTDPVLLTRKSFAGRKGFFFTKSSRSWRSSRLRGESWAGLSPRRREAREENATSKTRQRRRPHIANAVRRRQRRDVQQQAGGAVFRRRRRQTDTVAAHARPFDKFSALLTIPSASLTIAFRCDWSLTTNISFGAGRPASGEMLGTGRVSIARGMASPPRS